jgi:lipopolysaccharide/colanic/teichoic acid biosynthesis glycosyltransferase
VVVTVVDQNVLVTARDVSANDSAELVTTAEMINSALLYTTGCDVLLIGGFRFMSGEAAGAITAASEETGVPVAFIDADNLAGGCAEGSGLEGFQPIGSFSCLHNTRFVQLQRVLDIAVAGFLLFLLGPVFLMIAIAIRLDSTGPSFFIQERVGKNGRHFQILKFRSMFVTAPHYAASPRRSSDPRITTVGRLLRRLGLDELPQLINVLKGDMSVVGPRPEMPFLVERHRALHRERLRVKPGITGLWQLSPDRRHPIHENVHHDLYYIGNGNLFLDLAILVHTLFRATPGGI